MQFQADILGVPVVRPQVTETTALGAAYLGRTCHGLLGRAGRVAGKAPERRSLRTNDGPGPAFRTALSLASGNRTVKGLDRLRSSPTSSSIEVKGLFRLKTSSLESPFCRQEAQLQAQENKEAKRSPDPKEQVYKPLGQGPVGPCSFESHTQKPKTQILRFAQDDSFSARRTMTVMPAGGPLDHGCSLRKDNPIGARLTPLGWVKRVDDYY